MPMRAVTLKGIYLFAELDSGELSRLEAICTVRTVSATPLGSAR